RFTPPDPLCLTAPPPPASYSVSLHAALPISRAPTRGAAVRAAGVKRPCGAEPAARAALAPARPAEPSRPCAPPPARSTSCHGSRSEEHTSELQSRENLVCRLLLEKKNPVQPA